MNELQEILKGLQELKDRIYYLKNSINGLIKLKGCDPWGSQSHMDGLDSYWPKTEPKFKIPTFEEYVENGVRTHEVNGVKISAWEEDSNNK